MRARLRPDVLNVPLISYRLDTKTSKTHLRLYHTILRTRDEHKALDFHEVCQLGGVELADAYGVALLLRLLEGCPQVFDERKVGG